jgi:excisionase family DNA binding protein
VVQNLLLTVPECAVELAISRARAYELVAAGTLPAVRIGRATRVPRAALEAWIVDRLGERQAGVERSESK